MKIGIIGTGAIGGTIARKMKLAGHTVKVSSADEFAKVSLRAAELGVNASKLEDVFNDVDVAILSVPTIAIENLSKEIFKKLSKDAVVIDTSNYYPFRDQQIKDLVEGKVESVWVQEKIGHPVVKAFNNLLAHTLEFGGRPSGADDRIAMALSGDNEQAKSVVSQLINDAGFDYVDAGKLSDSWRHQPGTPAYCTELSVSELKAALDKGDKDKAPSIRDSVISTLGGMAVMPKHEEIVIFNRNLFPVNPKTNSIK